MAFGHLHDPNITLDRRLRKPNGKIVRWIALGWDRINPRDPMAVAFTREEDYEAQAADLPDRPVSSLPNLVTASGLASIEQALASARAAYAAAQAEGGISGDRTAMARATRDLRYWSSRRGSAQLTEPEAQAGVVQFGNTVEIEREDA